MVIYVAQVLTVVAIFALLAVSLNLTLGYTGVFSLAHAVFFGCGAYAAAKLQLSTTAPWPSELVIAAIVGAVAAVLVGLLFLQLDAESLIIATLALQLVASTVFLQVEPLTGGTLGIYGIPRPTVLGAAMSSTTALAVYTVVVVALLVLLARTLVTSPLGLAMRAGRDDGDLARSFGRYLRSSKLVSFTVAGAMAGVAGALYGGYIGYIDPGMFDLNQSVAIVAIVAVGGLGNVYGSVLAAAVLVSIPQILQFLPGDMTWIPQLQSILYGGVLLLLTLIRPQGLLPERALVRSPRARGPREVRATRARTAPAVTVRHVSKSFGGVHALQDVSLTVEPGRVTALIGPNGAGKSTLFNVVSGFEQPGGGSVRMADTELVGLAPQRISGLGLGRTFQDLRPFFGLTAIENVTFALGSPRSERSGLALLRRRAMWRAWRHDIQAAAALLERFQLGAVADRRVRDLSYGEAKLLIVAMQYARDSDVVLLDELAAGLDQDSIDEFASLVRAMADAGRTVCLVEHNLDFVWATADHVIVMHNGQVFAEGSPEEIRADPEVAAAYFGTTAVVHDA